MNRIVLIFSIALLFSLLFFLHRIDAVESDLKGVANVTVNNGTDTSLVGEQEKEGKEEEGKKVGDGEDVKEMPVKKKDEPSEEESKKQVESEKGSLNEGLDEKKLPVGDSSVVECDPSNWCIVEKSKFVACLRVPGKDSLDLSLLIQNKGTGPLDVNIHAPDFVNLEIEVVQLMAKENKEVKVSVKDGGGNNDTIIVLKAGEGSCNLNFQNMVSDTSKKSEVSVLPGNLGRFSIRSSFILVVLAAALFMGLVLSCIRFWRIKAHEGGPRYQQLDAGLPVSTGGKKDTSDGDGWDNSWGDDWDDEEAPVTPSKPVLTPSSKGLASRRFNKDSWKD